MSKTPFHILEWIGKDILSNDEAERFVVTGFGRNLLGQTCSISFEHFPTFLVRSHCELQQFLPNGERKADMKPQQMFDSYRLNQLELLLEYCVQDVHVTYLLAEKLSILPSMIESAAISWVTPTMIASRGQQIRVYSVGRAAHDTTI